MQRFLFLLSPILLLLSGCAAYNYTEADAPLARTTITPFSPAPKIAIVFGAGGPRGYAHVGIINVLEANGVKPDLIVGTSVGALIGAFWASGLPAAEIASRAQEGGPFTLFDLNVFADRGWIRGQRLENYVRDEISARTIEQLRTPMIIVATAREAKTPVYFASGNVGVAVRASSAVPQVISPVGIAGVEYEDGDVSLPVAVSAARAAGAQFVIAVDVSAHEGRARDDGTKVWTPRDIERKAKIAPEVAKADFLIHPDMGYTASPRRAYFDRATRAGEETAQRQIADLLAAIKALRR